jgi:hypothetical protein
MVYKPTSQSDKPKKQKAHMIYELAKYQVKISNGIVKITNPFVAGCELKKLLDDDEVSFRKFLKLLRANTTHHI